MIAAPSGAGEVVYTGVSFGYPAQAIPVLNDVEWRIDDGEFIVVAGESGSGKSTLLRCMNGLVPHFSGGRFRGSVISAGYDTRQYGPRTLSQNVGFVFQDPDAQRVAAIVEDELAFGMEQLGVEPLTMRKRIEEVLDLLGIAGLRRREVDTLSGGERQRVAVAAALTVQPRLLVLDEPTSQLDPWGADEVITAIERLNHDLGLTIVMSEHRLERVLAVADRLRVMSRDTVLDGPPVEILNQVGPELLPPVARFARMKEWRPLPLTIKAARQTVRETGYRLGLFPTPPSLATGEPVVTVDRVSARHGRRIVLDEISFEVRAGEIVALMGRNGSGKTTLLRTIMGFHRPDRGAVVVNGQPVRFDRANGAPPGIGYLPQRPGALLFNESVAAELAYTLRFRVTPNASIDALLAELDLAGLRDRNPRDLSVGEQERTALAAVLVADPRVLLLDEPTRGMDPRP